MLMLLTRVHGNSLLGVTCFKFKVVSDLAFLT